MKSDVTSSVGRFYHRGMITDEEFRAFVAAKRAEQAEIRRYLAPYETGQMKFFSGPSSGAKYDVTANIIERGKREIASIEEGIAIVTAHREGSNA